MNADEIKRLKVARVKCDKSLLFFTRFFFNVLHKQKFIVNWHHKDLCEAFERVGKYIVVFLNINQPPRTSKTELAVNFIAKSLGENPGGNFLYITASDDLRSEVSVKIRDIVTCPEYIAMYGVELKKDQNAKNLWRTKQGGGLKTATIQGQITGFGAGQMIEHNELEDYIRNFEGCIILDDINKIGDALTENANNDKANKRIFDTIFSRKNSPDTPIINIQQRSGLDDATANLLEYYEGKDNYESIVLPIINEEGIPMWEWKFPLEDIESLKTNPKTSHMFETQYMQNPMPLEGMALAKGTIKTYKSIPTEIIEENGVKKEVEQGWNFAFIDTADEGKDNFAMPILRVIGNYVYLKDCIFDQENLTVQLSQVAGKLKEHDHFAQIVVETNSAGAFFKRTLALNHPDTEFWGQWSKGNKMARILSYAGIIKLYFLFPENPNPDVERYMNQVYRLLKTSKDKDDAPDALAGAAAHLELHYGLFND